MSMDHSNENSNDTSVDDQVGSVVNPNPTDLPVGPLGDIIKSSRSFLHDVSNQLLIAHGMESFVANNLKKRGDIDEKILSKMDKSLKAMDKIMDMMKDHKNFIITVSSNNGPG